jgi:DNA invertase Pin-like site-specific DNA recombinase
MTETDGREIPVALYDRLSTKAQAEEGYAGEGHLHELREHMKATGRRIVEEVPDDPGEKRWMHDRPGIRRIKELAQAGEIAEVWAWSWTRYGESPVPEVLRIELAEHGVILRSLDDGGEGLGGEIMRAVMGVLSRDEQRERVRRSRMGTRSKARQGRVVGNAPGPRYGFRRVRNESGRTVGYEVDPERMAVVGRIFGMLDAGAAIHAVQVALERDGVEPPRGRSPRWARDTIRNMVREDSYLVHTPEELAALVAEGLLDEAVHSGLDREKPYGIAYFGRKRTSYVSTRSKKRKVEPVPRSEWIAVPVSLEGSGLERAKVERSRAAIADNRVPSKVGDHEYELSRGFLDCSDCGRAMTAAPRRFREKGTAFHYYYCAKNHKARGLLPECPNRKSHEAFALEYHAGLLFEESVSQETLLALYDQAIEQQNGSGNESGLSERRTALTERLATLAAMRDKFQRQEAEDLMTLDELRERLAEIEEEKVLLTAELRAVEDEATAVRRIEAARGSISSYTPVHAEWYEDPEAVMPWEVLTHAAGPEDRRRAYRRYGARFEIGGEGDLTLKLDLNLDGGIMSLTSTRS